MRPDPGPPPAPAAAEHVLDVAALTDIGTERVNNEDACGTIVEGPCAIVAVADGVSSGAGGEVASEMAVEVTLRAWREESASLGAGQRLYRAVQQANIEIYDRAVAVPELRGMATTLVAVAVDRGELTAVHVGDSRLYLVRGGEIVQLTKDHTVAAEKVRFGLLSKEKARESPDRSVLTRSVGRELIVSRDRLSRTVEQGDVLLLCSDGLYNVLRDEEIAAAVSPAEDAGAAARALVDAANARGTGDNLTAAVVRVVSGLAAGGAPIAPPAGGIGGMVRRLLGRGS
ncbi:MAG TPA: protein phosphatase 2C domain-containing protein [Anaeromyxobacteraceae bacterium]|nr:protein phosphatase 2C domain-containing protein [Anaeromyxobacteraceae bacterium]